MGQALRRATGMVSKPQAAPPSPAPPQSRIRNVEAPLVPPGRAVPPIGAQGRLGGAPDDSEISKPGNGSNILEERDPDYDSMLRQMTGRISSKPGGKLEMGEALIVERYDRPLPKVRSSKADIGQEEKTQTPGTLSAVQLREILLLYNGKSEEHPGRMAVEDIAQRFRVEVSQVHKILQYVSLAPEEATNKKSQS